MLSRLTMGPIQQNPLANCLSHAVANVSSGRPWAENSERTNLRCLSPFTFISGCGTSALFEKTSTRRQRVKVNVFRSRLCRLFELRCVQVFAQLHDIRVIERGNARRVSRQPA